MEKSTTTDTSTSTQHRLVESARELFWSRGYKATTMGEVAKRAGANPGSLYYFFKTKEELLLAVLDLYTQLLGPAVIEPAFRANEDPIVRVFMVLEGYRRGLIETDFTHGCPIGNLALEIGEALPSARVKIASNFTSWVGWIRKCLDQAGDRLPSDLDRQAAAQFVLALMEGAVMQARAHRSIEPFDAVVLTLRDYFARLIRDAALQSGPR